jgi:haloacetate dehalogenase
VLVIGGGRSHTARLYGYEQAWSAYATDLARCVVLPCGHYPAEQAPDETYAELRGFDAAPPTDRARRPSGDRRSRCRCSA